MPGKPFQSKLKHYEAELREILASGVGYRGAAQEINRRHGLNVSQIAVFSSCSCYTPNPRARISARRNFPDYDPRSNQSKLNTTDENQTKRHKPEFRRSYLTSRRFCRWNRTCKGNSNYYSTTNQSHFPKTDSCHSGIARLFAVPVRSPSQRSKGHCHFLGKWNPQTQRGSTPIACRRKKPPRSTANRLRKSRRPERKSGEKFAPLQRKKWHCDSIDGVFWWTSKNLQALSSRPAFHLDKCHLAF